MRVPKQTVRGDEVGQFSPRWGLFYAHIGLRVCVLEGR